MGVASVIRESPIGTTVRSYRGFFPSLSARKRGCIEEEANFRAENVGGVPLYNILSCLRHYRAQGTVTKKGPRKCGGPLSYDDKSLELLFSKSLIRLVSPFCILLGSCEELFSLLGEGFDE
jgi:hypothetical protein